MKLLVTGGAGFMPSDFVRFWLVAHPDDRIVVLDKLTYAGNLENLSSVEKSPNFKFVKGDICDQELVDKLVKEVDVIVHYAAESHVDRSILDPAPFIQTNVVGTQVLLESALKNGKKRFHHVSTDEVFGALDLHSASKFNEKTPYNPRSPYAASKAAGDHLVRAYFETYSLPITISNSSNNFGPYHFPEKFIPLSITNLLEGRKIPIYGDGLYVRDWLFVRDHSEAVGLILKKGRVGETYLLSADNEYSNIDVAKKILIALDKNESNIEFIKDRPGHDRRYAIDASKIKKELGWSPKYSDFDKALEETIDWFRGNKKWWQRVRSGAYQKYYANQYGKR